MARSSSAAAQQYMLAATERASEVVEKWTEARRRSRGEEMREAGWLAERARHDGVKRTAGMAGGMGGAPEVQELHRSRGSGWRGVAAGAGRGWASESSSCALARGGAPVTWWNGSLRSFVVVAAAGPRRGQCDGVDPE
ncbi:hypothetical protein ABZP36_010136 [Zizania latifolia]